MTLLEQTCAAVVPVDASAAAAAQKRLDFKTKPRDSLGRLEELACRLAAIYRTPDPELPARAVVVMAADHGVAEEGVSAYPQEVTAQMVKNFAAGFGLLAVGDMGIGKTTASSAITAVLTGESAEGVTGCGTGIDEERRRRKVDAIERALHVNRPDPGDALDVLAKVGGFEIAGLAGIMLGAAAHRVPVLLDGFITGASALAVIGLCPSVRDYLIASHRSVEPGHEAILRHLELKPLLDQDMRLGEGTGAVLAMSLAEAALRILREMATFEAAGVTDAGA